MEQNRIQKIRLNRRPYLSNIVLFLFRMLLVSKICAAVLLAVLRLLAGLLPLKIHRKLTKWSQDEEEITGKRRRERIDAFLSIFLCFGAGLLLSTCFVHMFPEVIICLIYTPSH